MARRKIAILGGGVASLTAAFELTRTPELAARHEVTIHQMGWRLGGKAASGRNLSPHRGKRIEEHGLHVWLGFYENAFRMIRAAYAERKIGPDEALATWRDAFKPQSFTPIGEKRRDGTWTYWGVDWPTNVDEPGDDKVLLSPWGGFTELISMVERLVRAWGRAARRAIADAAHDLSFFERVAATIAGDVRAVGEVLVEDFFHGVWATVKKLPGDVAKHTVSDHSGISSALLEFRSRLRAHVNALSSGDDELQWIWNVIDLGIAIARGMLNPKYGILTSLDLERIDGYDLRAWLIENGATASMVNDGSEVRALYDLPFAYEDGQLDRPSFAAGTALRVLLRLVLTYKGAVMFLMQSGMGEAVVAPLYQVLRARGVKFEFFHKVRKLELSPDGNVVARVKLDLQAKTVGDEPYEPTFRVKGVTAWPSEPFWDQLDGGAKLRDEGVNFESNWCQQPPVGSVELVAGRDFDDVVLGISLGAFKKLSDQPTMCDELYHASPRFAAMANALSLVPTQAVQLWTIPDLEGLGWTDPRPAADAWPEILDVWADMSHELPREDWRAPGPRSIQYLCSILPTTLHRRPTTDAGVPAEALRTVRANMVDWFSQNTGFMWPKATTAADKNALDYAVLYDEANGAGVARLDAQWLRANVDPTECYVASIRGTTSARLGPRESGFANLILAGDWTKNGINAGCVEAAVMSGMAASRAICGSPAKIVGEDFFRKPAGDSESAMRSLPSYVSGLRHGEQSIEPPGIIRGGHCSIFVVEEGDVAKRQAFVNAMLNDPTGGKVRYSVLGPAAFVLFMQAPELTSPTEIVGYIPDQECAVAIPLIDLHRGSFGVWMPYIFISSSVGMVTGREVWGFQKEISTFEFPSPTDPSPKFVANATIFETLAPNTLGKLAPLVTVQKPQPIGPLVPRATSPAAAFAEILGRVTKGSGKLLSHLSREAFDVADLFGPLSFPAINFKQFRDAVDPTLACYQAIVESPLQLDQLTGFGLLGDGYTLSITPCQSHTIAEDLGLAPNVPVTHAFYVDMGFSAMPGRVVWQAT